MSGLEPVRLNESAEAINFLDSVKDQFLTEENLFQICQLIESDDKGIRYSISNLLINNSSPSIPTTLVPLLSHRNISIRNFIAEILVNIGSRSVDALLDYIAKGDEDDKKLVIDSLGLIGDTSAGGRILAELKVSKNENIILSCLEALGNMKYEAAVPDIISRYDSNDVFKPTIIEALGKTGSPDALSFILSRYNDEDELTKFSIIESLGLIGDEDTFFFLLSELNDRRGILIWPIIKAVYNLKEKFSFDIPFDERMRNAILQIIFEAEGEYRKIAASMLSVFNDKEILSAYLEILGEDADTDTIIITKIENNLKIFFELIGAYLMERPKNIKNLMGVLKTVTELQFREIYSFLSALQARNITDSLSQLINDYDEEIRITAFELLFLYDINSALLFADDICRDQNYWNRLRLLEIIEESNLPEMQPILKILTDDPEEMIRERALSISERLNN